MVRGLDLLARQFADYKDQYILIGATACSLAFDDSGQEFRVTHDIDMVLIVEALSNEFIRAFWRFVKDGGYEHQLRSQGRPQYYRFEKPAKSEYPSMIELFSRKPDALDNGYSGHLVSLPVDEDLSSLSAILLDDAYYHLIREGKHEVQGLSCLKTEYLIVLKAKAWLDMTLRQQDGQTIDSRKINKHKNDVLRLYTIVVPGTRVTLPCKIKEDILCFLDALEQESLPLKELGLSVYKPESIITGLRNIFC